MSGSLFRPQAINTTARFQFGEPIVYQPTSLRIQCAFLALIFASLLAFILLVPIKSFENVSGELVLVHGAADVYSPRRGVLRELAVWEGQSVKRGEILAQASNDSFDETGRNELKQQIEFFEAQIDLLRRKRKLLAGRADTELSQQKLDISAERRELENLKKQQTLVDSRVQLSERTYHRDASLWHREMLSTASYERSSDTFLAAQIQATNNQLSLLAKEREVHKSQLRIDIAPLQVSEQLLDVESAILQLQSQRDERLAMLSFAVVAPRDGVVGNIAFSVGDQLDPSSPILRILASENAFEAQLFIPSRGLSKLKVGQVVLLEFEALPKELHGRFRGVVKNVSAAQVSLAQLPLAFRPTEPMFLVTVAMDKAQFPGRTMSKLRDGMRLNAEVIIDEMSVLARILMPLARARLRL